ncbi:D-alanyl-D-alanine carboxypeptidase/D-alanyl-D-alanine endopeptidase [Nitratifractor sp.]
MRLGVLLVALWAWGWALVPAEVAQFLQRDGIDPSQVSLIVAPTKGSEPLMVHLPDEPRRPASVIKLLTTYAALLELGPDFRWPTRFFVTGRLRGGVLRGDLIVKAYGDPTLSRRDLDRIAERIRRMGIREITGDLIVDESFFRTGSKISSGFDNHPHSEYNAMPEALMFEDHLSTIVVDTRGGEARVHKGIPDPGYRLLNEVTVRSDKRCRGRYGWPAVRFEEEGDTPIVRVTGTLSSRCRTPRVIRQVIDHPYTAFYGALKEAFAKRGIAFSGRLRLGKVPAGARPLLTHYSRPLLQIVAKTNKHSNNLYARHIFLLLGAKRYGAPATVEKGRKAVREILESRGILDDATVLDNGCGLSRRTRTTARTLYRLLEDAYRHFAWRWMGALSIAGIDGTLRHRFVRSPARRHAWMKTGTLKDAKNIAGYVKGRSGRLYTVVIFYNGPARWKGRQFEDQLVEWIVKNK